MGPRIHFYYINFFSYAVKHFLTETVITKVLLTKVTRYSPETFIYYYIDTILMFRVFREECERSEHFASII